MVSFICEGCQDTIKKPKLDQHRSRCGAPFTCIDCSTTFAGPAQYKSHTSCISEAQKYQKSLYKPKPTGPPEKGRNYGARGSAAQGKSFSSRGWPRSGASGANDIPLGPNLRMRPVDPIALERPRTSERSAQASTPTQAQDLPGPKTENSKELKGKSKKRKIADDVGGHIAVSSAGLEANESPEAGQPQVKEKKKRKMHKEAGADVVVDKRPNNHDVQHVTDSDHAATSAVEPPAKKAKKEKKTKQSADPTTDSTNTPLPVTTSSPSTVPANLDATLSAVDTDTTSPKKHKKDKQKGKSSANTPTASGTTVPEPETGVVGSTDPQANAGEQAASKTEKRSKRHKRASVALDEDQVVADGVGDAVGEKRQKKRRKSERGGNGSENTEAVTLPKEKLDEGEDVKDRKQKRKGKLEPVDISPVTAPVLTGEISGTEVKEKKKRKKAKNTPAA